MVFKKLHYQNCYCGDGSNREPISQPLDVSAVAHRVVYLRGDS